MQIFKAIALSALLAISSSAFSEPKDEIAALLATAPQPDAKADSLGEFMADKGLIAKLSNAGALLGDGATGLVNSSMGFLGMPYRFGGNGEQDGGVDCSGLVRTVYQRTLGKILPRRAADQAAATKTIAREELQPGDLVFFNTMQRAFSHVGIYIGNNQFIHAPRSGGVVRIENMDVSYWQSRFNGARRVDTTQNDSVSTN